MDEDPEIKRIVDRKMESFLARRLNSSSEGEQDGVVNVSDEDFGPKILQADLPAIVDFWAAWCGPCKDMEPVFRRIASRHRGKMIFARLDSDKNRATAIAYLVKSIPTMMIFENGAEKGRVVGRVSEQELETAITPYISG